MLGASEHRAQRRELGAPSAAEGAEGAEAGSCGRQVGQGRPAQELGQGHKPLGGDRSLITCSVGCAWH